VDTTTAIGEIPAAVDPITDRYGQHRHLLICELHFQRTRPYHASAALRPDAPENLTVRSGQMSNWAIDDHHRATVILTVTIFDISQHDREDACLSPACGGKFRTGIRTRGSTRDWLWQIQRTYCP